MRRYKGKRKGKPAQKQNVRLIISALLLAGVIILIIGFYYSMCAAIPYQDPTPELQIQYEIDGGIGRVLTRTGLCVALIGATAKLLYWFICRKTAGRNE